MTFSKVIILLYFWEELQMKESEFQLEIKKTIKAKFPNAIIKKQDGLQGFPDLLILNGNKWAALEVKRSSQAHHQPNQENYISRMNSMSYASFIFPENKEEVLDEVFKALKS